MALGGPRSPARTRRVRQPRADLTTGVHTSAAQPHRTAKPSACHRQSDRCSKPARRVR